MVKPVSRRAAALLPPVPVAAFHTAKLFIGPFVPIPVRFKQRLRLQTLPQERLIRMNPHSGTWPRNLVLGCLLASGVCTSAHLHAQAPAVTAPTPASRQIGTVRAISADSLTLATDTGSSVAVSLADTVRVVQLPPGSTDIKAAQPAAVSDIAEGDRVLVIGRPGQGSTVAATRIVLMKGAAIAQNNAVRQGDWQRRGSGGIVSAVDPSSKTIAITSGARKISVETSGTTTFRRYAPGSVKFEEAKPSTLAELQPGDQLRVRGTKSPDGTTVTAEEIVSGAFRNLAGTIVSVDAAGNAITLKDLATKKNVIVAITPESSLRHLPPEMAARFAARASGATAASRGPGSNTAASPGPNSGSTPAAGAGSGANAIPGSTPSGNAASASGQPRRPQGNVAGQASPEHPESASGEASGPASGQRSEHPAGGSGRAGADLSQVIGTLPPSNLADLKAGEAVMIVASASSGSAGPVTAITLLSGVEPLLAASPQGSSFNLSPWSLGGGEGGGEAAAQ